VPKTDRNYLQALKPKVEDKFKDLLGIKLESLIPRELTEEQQQMVALNKDLMEVNMKEIRAVKSLQSHFKEGADIMTQLTAVMAQMAKENAKGMLIQYHRVVPRINLIDLKEIRHREVRMELSGHVSCASRQIIL
ncbi:hypothetical protein F5051DRAFT_434513, partial [Lentinula edodes]